ncbi:MAG: prefoldin subunit alpha [Candidatus Heimdallarchaeota archaeon]|nr:prefoldin subunit alpha [Candidatus Heimdallarchaeota archaeon]
MSSVNMTDEFNELYGQYQNIVKQLQYLEQQEIQFSGLISDLKLNISTLQGLETNQESDEIIIPLGGLILVKAKLKEIGSILLNAGSNVIIPSTIDNAKNKLEDRVNEFVKIYDKIVEDRVKLETIAENLSTQLNQLSNQ